MPPRRYRWRVRYFLDTEFNGFGGALLSLALVPEDGSEFYITLAFDGELNAWVERNVLPYFDHVPVGLVSPRLSLSPSARSGCTTEACQSTSGLPSSARRTTVSALS